MSGSAPPPLVSRMEPHGPVFSPEEEAAAASPALRVAVELVRASLADGPRPLAELATACAQAHISKRML